MATPMNREQLAASLDLWDRRLTYRVNKLAAVRKDAHAGGTVTDAEAEHIHKWERLVAEAHRNIALRQRQLRALAPKQSARDRAVARAKHWAGTTENPAGSNQGGRITVWEQHFGFGPVPWCGVFVGNMLSWAGVQGVNSRIAAVALIEDDARAGRAPFRGWNSGGNTAGVEHGDLVVMFGRGVHVEMVVGFGPGVVFTVGGNTSSGNAGSQSNGGGVFPRTRALSDVHGFAKVNYPG